MTRRPPALFAAHDLAIFRRLFEEAAVDHPVDLFLKFVGLIGLHADEFRHQPALALFRRKIAQHLLARAVFVLAQPRDGAIERAAQFRRGFVVDVIAGDDAAAPAQIGDLARAFGRARG